MYSLSLCIPNSLLGQEAGNAVQKAMPEGCISSEMGNHFQKFEVKLCPPSLLEDLNLANYL